MILDDLTTLYERPPETASSPVSFSSGVDALDRVCGGGLWTGAVILVEADLAAHARALLCAVARKVDHPVLVATASTAETSRWLLAGAADVPAAVIRTGQLSRDDWDSIHGALAPLANRDVFLSDAGSLSGLAPIVTEGGRLCLLIEDIHRFGPGDQTLETLTRWACDEGLAVVATAHRLDDVAVPISVRELVTRISMASHGLGGRAVLVNIDGPEGFEMVQAEVDCLVATLT